jgi:hypothetical protein
MVELAVWIFDRGVISEENLQTIRRRGGQYLVGTPRSKLKEFERELLEGDWHQIRPEVEVQRVGIPNGEETYILCRSTARKDKEQAIRSRFSTRPPQTNNNCLTASISPYLNASMSTSNVV